MNGNINDYAEVYIETNNRLDGYREILNYKQYQDLIETIKDINQKFVLYNNAYINKDIITIIIIKLRHQQEYER